MKVGYLDCCSGLSGDMALGALLDCGLSLDLLTAELARLPITGYRIYAQPMKRGIITGTQATVHLEEKTSEQRCLNDILDLIQKSSLNQHVKERSMLIFKRLAEAEARVHCIPIADVHFHEVGAIDAIVDIVGAVVGLDHLGIEALFSSPLPSGSGTVETRHGIIPIPAPATLELIASSGAPIRPTPDRDMELVTPTGAAIVTTLASFERPTMSLQRIGYGIGACETTAIPNVLPLWLGKTIEEEHRDDEASGDERKILLLETNIDDMSPELLGYTMDRLFEQGALDVWFTPIQMKKNRPAVMLSVLAPPATEGQVVETLLRETSTIGLRVQPVLRHYASREEVQIDSSLGQVAVKVKRLHGEIVGISPEYEDCHRLAEEHGLPLKEIFHIVATEASAKLTGK